MAQKYQIEKVIHEMIRDNALAFMMNENYEHGTITTYDYLRHLAEIYRKEKENETNSRS